MTPTNLILALLQDPEQQGQPFSEDLISHCREIFEAFQEHPKSSESALQWASNVMKATLAESIRGLTEEEHGWHFNAKRTKVKKLVDFRIEDMAHVIESEAKELWDLIGQLLAADEGLERRRKRDERARARKAKARDADGDHIMQEAESRDNDDDTDSEVDDDDVRMADDVDVEGASHPNFEKGPRGARERREALMTIVS